MRLALDSARRHWLRAAAFAASTALLAARAGAQPSSRAGAPFENPEPAKIQKQALAVELAADGLWARVCPTGPCAARGGRRITLPEEVAQAHAQARISSLEPWPGRSVAHVYVPLAQGAWEALIAAPPGEAEARAIFSGFTGLRHGEEGERQGESVWIRSDEQGARVLVGSIREDVELCGRRTLLEPRLLDRELSLRPAKVQQLSTEERRDARVLRAARVEPGAHASNPAALNALRTLAASSALGDPRALTDGRADTSWAEARGGDGRGEFVVLRPMSGVGLVALELLVRPDGSVPASGAAPRVLWWVTREQTYRIDFEDDAWQSPGVWYRVSFPEPIYSDCAALVLEQSQKEAPDTIVSLAELRGVGELEALSAGELVAKLSTPGDAGAGAVPALQQLGPAGVQAVLGAFGALDRLGRRRALDVLASAPCAAAAPVYVELAQDADEALRRRAEQLLSACVPEASAALRKAFEASSPESGVNLARVLGRFDPALAVELVGARLATLPRKHRAAYRDELGRLAREPRAAAAFRELLQASATRVQVEVLRALGDALPAFAPEASEALGRSAGAATSFADRFVLLAPAAELAAVDPRAADILARALSDADVYLRLTAARMAPRRIQEGLLSSARDPEVRVREASVLRMGELSVPGAEPVLIERLADDDWPLVRAAAAQSLGALRRPSPGADAGLAGGLEDDATSVRLAAVRALGRRGALRYRAQVVERFSDTAEDAYVRAAAAAALGEMCDMSALDVLTAAAAKLLAKQPAPDDVVIGSAAMSALGRLSPADLPERLAPFLREPRRPGLEPLLERAQPTARSCRPAPAASNREH